MSKNKQVVKISELKLKQIKANKQKLIDDNKIVKK